MDTNSSAVYSAYEERSTTRAGTLSRNIWLAQDEEPEPKKHSPPSPFNLLLAMAACLFCPLLGWLSIIFAAQAKLEYNKGNYHESSALCTRSRGTSFYSIAIGIGLVLGYGVLVGAGLDLGWYN